MKNVSINRSHKDHLFKALFEEKGRALSLYNALNGTNYSDENLVEFTTLDDAIYISVKNDISFLITDYMELWEHQSTLNPNLPLRGLQYFARLYEKYVAVNDLNIYGSKRLKLPTPQFLVFYNGTAMMDEEETLCFTDLLVHPEKSDIEITARVININESHNKSLSEKCETLNGYVRLNEKIRKRLQLGKTLEIAINESVDECIEEGYLSDFLFSHKAEVADMILTGYDEQTLKRWFYRDGYEDGIEQGRKEALDALVHDGVLTQEEANARMESRLSVSSDNNDN